MYSHSSFSSLAMNISDMYNFGVGHHHDADILFSNFCKLYSPRLRCWLELGNFRFEDCEISSFSKRYIFSSEADLERSGTGSGSTSEECVYLNFDMSWLP